MARTTCPTICSQLAGFLRESYPDSRGEWPTSASGLSPIRIDDRRSTDVSSDFCHLSVLSQETPAPQFTLYLKDPPLDDEIIELICDKDGTITGVCPDLHVEIPLLTKEVGFLRELARAFRRIVGRGRTYPNANWKWVCRRTANSLDRLADRLTEYRKLRRHTPWRQFASSSLTDAAGSAGSGPPGDSPRVGTTAYSNHADDEDIFRRLGME